MDCSGSVNQGKSHFIPELKNRWGTFCEKIQFYGVFKKVMRPPLADKGNYTLDRESIGWPPFLKNRVLDKKETIHSPKSFAVA
jgi:hypothetical protein